MMILGRAAHNAGARERERYPSIFYSILLHFQLHLTLFPLRLLHFGSILTLFSSTFPHFSRQLPGALARVRRSDRCRPRRWHSHRAQDAKNCPAYGACGTYARKRDPSRFTTWADDQDTHGACYEHATLISFNDYPGWYNHQGDPQAPKIWSSLAAAVIAPTLLSFQSKMQDNVELKL